MIIAIDGPAGAGKGTLAQSLARHYGLRYLDTGLLYRAIGMSMAKQGLDLGDPVAATRVAANLDPAELSDPMLRSRQAGESASRIAIHPGVRAALLAFQRDFANGKAGAVLDGRDIGTVVAPFAEVKIFVTASPEVRAQRRLAELNAKGQSADRDAILAEILARDARDCARAAAPLRAAADAYLLDTSGMDIETAFRAAVDIVERARNSRE